MNICTGTSIVSLNEEQWADILGYENYYKISSFGRVKSCNRVVVGKSGQKLTVKEKLLKLSINIYGYQFVQLSNKKGGYGFFIHVLVAETFIRRKEQGEQVNHKDGIKVNNHLSNLEIVTNIENVQHAIKNGLWPCRKGISNGKNKLKESDVLDISKSTERSYLLAKKYNISRAVVSSIKKGRSWTHITGLKYNILEKSKHVKINK